MWFIIFISFLYVIGLGIVYSKMDDISKKMHIENERLHWRVQRLEEQLKSNGPVWASKTKNDSRPYVSLSNYISKKGDE